MKVFIVKLFKVKVFKVFTFQSESEQSESFQSETFHGVYFSRCSLFKVNTLSDVDLCIRVLLIAFFFFQFFKLFIIVKVFTWVG